MGELRVSQRTVEGITICDIVGDLDVAVLPILNEKLNAILRLSGSNSNILVNARRICYINSTAYEFLVQKMKKIRRRGGQFGMCSLSNYNATLIHLKKKERTGLSADGTPYVNVPIYANEKEAVKAMSRLAACGSGRTRSRVAHCHYLYSCMPQVYSEDLFANRRTERYNRF